MKKYNISKNDILECISSGMTNIEIAKKYDISKSTLNNKFKEFDIKVRKDYSNIFTKEFLENNLCSITQLAKEYNCSTDVIWKYYKKHNVNYKKSLLAHSFLSDKNWLYEEYITKNKTITDISSLLKCGRKLIEQYIKEHNIIKKERYKEKVWNKNIKLDDLLSGKSSKEISELYGCSEEYVRQQQIKNNIPRLLGYTQSSIERKIHDILYRNNIQFISNNKNIIHPYEIDVYIPEHNLAIEINGIYFHTDKFVNKNYHEKKRLLCESNNIRLLHLYEDDINDKLPIIEDIILTSCNKSNKLRIFARKCEVAYNIDINTRKTFLDNNHIQGFAKSTESLGLYYNNELVALMLFEGNVLTRYVTSCHVIGGFSKLIKHSNKDYIKTYVDYNTFTGNVYEKSGFIKTSYIKPDYKYVYKNKRIHKFNFRKTNFKNSNELLYKENMTEFQLADLNNIPRIYDSGKGIYTWRKYPQENNLPNIA